MRDYLQNFFMPLAISAVTGVVIVSLSFNFGYATTFWLVCGLPLASCLVLWGLQSAPAKLRIFRTQLCWWHFLWLLVLLSGQVFRIRDVESIQANPLDLWALYRVVLMSVVALVLLNRLLFQRTQWDRACFQGLIGVTTGFALINLISALWSVYPMWTIYKATEYLIDLALITAVVVSVRTIEEFKTLFDFTWIMLSLLIGTVWLGIALWPERAILHGGLLGIQIQGVLPALETNGVGDLGAILGIVALTRLLFPTQQKRFYLIIFLISVLTLILSQSRTPLTGFLVGSALVLFMAKRIGVIALCVVLIPAVVSLTTLGDLFWEFFQRGQTTEEFESLSGRVAGWELGWKLFKEQPLIGFGAYAGARFAVLTQFGGAALLGSSILNTWLEVLLGTGLIGFTLLLGAFLGIWMVLLRSALGPDNCYSLIQRLGIEASGVLAILSVRSMFTVEFIWHPPLVFLLIVGYAELLRRAYREQAYESHPASVISHRVVNVP